MVQSHSHPLHALQAIAVRYKPDAPAPTATRSGWSALGIRIGKSNLLIPASNLVQIIRMHNLASPSSLPGSPEWVVGLVSYRGDLIPTIDLQHLLLGLPIASPAKGKLVCIRNKKEITGLLVPSLSNLKNFNSDQAVTRGPAFEGNINNFLAGVFKQDHSFWGVLNLEKISNALSHRSGGI